MNDTPRIPLLGYTDQLSGRPGDDIEFKVSSTSPNPYQACLVRIICADPNPEGPGIIDELVGSSFDGSYPSRIQAFQAGSCAQISVGERFSKSSEFTVMATVWPTLPGQGEQAVISQWQGDATQGCGYCLMLDDKGRPAFEVGMKDGLSLRVNCDIPVHAREWGLIWASVDADAGVISVGHAPRDKNRPRQQKSLAVGRDYLLAETADIVIAARNAQNRTAHYNGKIEDPSIYQATFDDAIVAQAMQSTKNLWARWDFSRAIETLQIEDVGPNRLDGELVNLPARAMTGSRWSGEEMCWKHAPDQYAAIH